MLLHFLKLFIFLNLSIFCYATTVTPLNNNLKEHLNDLPIHLSYFINNSNHEKEISSIFKLYLLQNNKILAFEIINQNRYLYSSFRRNQELITQINQPLPESFLKLTRTYQIDIVNNNKEYLATLIVYLKNQHIILNEQSQYKKLYLNEKETNYLKEKKVISMCIDPNFMPYEKVNNKGEYVGIIAELIKQISLNSGLKFQLKGISSWKDSLNQVKNKTCDILPYAAQTKKRDSFLLFTKSYFQFPTIFATQTSEIFITTLKNIKNQKIAMVKNFAVIELFKDEYPEMKIIEVRNTQEGLEKVSRGEVFAMVGSLPAIAYGIQEHQLFNVKIAGKTFDTLEAKIAIRKDEPILQAILNKAISTMGDPQRDKIINKWLTIVPKESFDTKLLIQIITIIFILSILLILTIIIRSNRQLCKVNKRLKILSTTDKLTGLYNRAKLDSIMLNEIKNSKRYGDNLSFIMIDIDYFKLVNDKYGHIEGDHVLQAFSIILEENIRETDYVGRWGGEEFIAILPHINQDNAYLLAEKLRLFIQNHQFDKNIHITASFGVYEYQDDNIETIVSNLDQALYKAKRESRNKVCVYGKE